MDEEPAAYFIGGPINKDIIALPYPMGRDDTPIQFQTPDNSGLQRFAFDAALGPNEIGDQVVVWYYPQPFYTEDGYRVWVIGEEPVMA